MESLWVVFGLLVGALFCLVVYAMFRFWVRGQSYWAIVFFLIGAMFLALERQAIVGSWGLSTLCYFLMILASIPGVKRTGRQWADTFLLLIPIVNIVLAWKWGGELSKVPKVRRPKERLSPECPGKYQIFSPACSRCEVVDDCKLKGIAPVRQGIRISGNDRNDLEYAKESSENPSLAIKVGNALGKGTGVKWFLIIMTSVLLVFVILFFSTFRNAGFTRSGQGLVEVQENIFGYRRAVK